MIDSSLACFLERKSQTIPQYQGKVAAIFFCRLPTRTHTPSPPLLFSSSLAPLLSSPPFRGQCRRLESRSTCCFRLGSRQGPAVVISHRAGWACGLRVPVPSRGRFRASVLLLPDCRTDIELRLANVFRSGALVGSIIPSPTPFVVCVRVWALARSGNPGPANMHHPGESSVVHGFGRVLSKIL